MPSAGIQSGAFSRTSVSGSNGTSGIILRQRRKASSRGRGVQGRHARRTAEVALVREPRRSAAEGAVMPDAAGECEAVEGEEADYPAQLDQQFLPSWAWV